MLRKAIVVFCLVFISACSTYRTGSGYRGGKEYAASGGGIFKPPGEYSGRAAGTKSSSAESSTNSPETFNSTSSGNLSAGDAPGIDSKNFSENELRGARSHLNRGRSFTPKGPFKLSWPVQSVHINRGFKPESDPHHEGLDLGGKRGTPIASAHDGVVIYAGNGFSGFGNMVLVEYNSEWATLYAHLDGYAVKEGHILTVGDPIGTMGATGHATGVHLHFELMHNRTPVDPLQLLTGGRQMASELSLRKSKRSVRRR